MRILKYLALSSLTALALTPLCPAQAQLAGDWQGTLSAGGQDFRLVWHVVKAADGSVTSTYDNVDQGVFGIKVKSMVLNGSDLTLTIDTVIQPNGEDLTLRGVVAGKVSANGNEFTGTWTQTDPEQPPVDLTLKRAQAAPPATASPQIAGDWHGALSAGDAELHVVFHFTAGSGGALSGTMDSVDQGTNGIPLTSVTLKDSKLSLAVDAVHGSYEGTLTPDAAQIKGTWSQGMPLELNLERGSLKVVEAKPAAPTDVDGSWQGTLDAGTVKLRLVYKIENTQDGLTAKMQSPDQSPGWTSAYPITRNGASLTIPIKANGSTYEGKLSADLASIEGTFSQAGNSFPLALKRVKEK
jgi:hypothetical protein